MLKTLLSYVKQYTKESLLSPLFVGLEALIDIIVPLFMASIIDDGIEMGNMSHVLTSGAAMVAFAALGLACGVLAGKFAAKASTGFAYNIRKGMYDTIQTYSFSNIDKFSTAGLITRLTTDVTNLQNSYQMIIRMAIRAPFMLIFAVIMSIRIHPGISSIFLIAIAFLGVVLFFIISKTMGIFDVVFKRYDDLNASVQENVGAIRVVKAFVREGYENKKFNTAADSLYKQFVKAEGILALNNPVMMFCVYGCMIALSWMGAKMIVIGDLTTGQLTTLFTYVMSILMSLMMISMIFVMITMSLASARRIVEVLNEKPDIVNPEEPVYEVADGSVAFDHVDFTYRSGTGAPVLTNINFSVKPGETIGIIGGTGSAKSSLVNLISRLYDVTNGSVMVGGKDVREYDVETLRNEVAVVLQKNVLFSGTILENLRWGDKDASDEECIRAAKLACADDFIRQFPDGYHTYIEQGGTNVSGGQKQRLCIARALLKKPKILILDDSTSAVDTATDARIRKAFREEIPNTTKFIIAQRISSVQDADRILVMEQGVLNGFDTHENLLKTNAIYREVYESQTKGSGDFDNPNGGAA